MAVNQIRVPGVLCRAIFSCLALLCPLSYAGTLPTLFESFAGNINYQMTGASFRTQPNTGNACALLPVAASANGTLAGIPAGATIRAAYLYWAGSGTTMDSQVIFNGSTVNASRTFTETFVNGPVSYDFFSGFADVTAQVAGNGAYGMTGLTVNTGAPHCAVQAVLSGWSMVVLYEHASQSLRVINVFDGFQFFRAGNIDLNPSNFRIPAAGCTGTADCKFGVITWEGDSENSGTSGGFTENLYINPPPPPPALTTAVNPANNQYNSTISLPDVVGLPNSTTSYGVDVDVYPLTSPAHLLPGDTSTVARYESGADLVILSAEIFAVRNVPVADLTLDKAHSGNFVAGQQGVYTLTVRNNGPNDTDVGSIVTVTDTLPASLTYVSGAGSGWSCGAAGQVMTCTHTGVVIAGASLPAITLTVNAAASAAPTVSNSATVSTNSTTFDHKPGNNTDSDSASVILPSLTTSTKSVLDMNGGDANPGDTLRYTITVTESAGGAVNGVSVTDSMHALLINFRIVSVGSGTDMSTAGTGPLNITNISVPANGSVGIVFDADIAGSATPGNVISNTAVVNNPVTGVNTNVNAPTVTVSASSVSGSGIKPLYFRAVLGASENAPTQPQNMSRVPLVAVSAPVLRARIRRQDVPLRWDMAPALQSTLGLSAAAIPVVLQMRRDANTTARNIRVSLDYAGAATGFLGCLDRSLPTTATDPANGLDTANTRTFTFNVPRTDVNCNPVVSAALVLPAGTIIRVTIDNQVGGAGINQPVYVYPFNDTAPTTSRIELPVTTVINVDSVAIVDNVAYPGGVAYSSYAPNETVRVRAVVRDPFGSFDISGVNIQILNPLASVVVPSTAMTLVNDSGVALRTYEYVFTVPSVGSNGYWTVRVVANEGSEGTVSDLGVGVFQVGVPSVSVMKLVSTLSDPVNNPSYPNSDAGANPKAIPGAVVEYRMVVTNTGIGPADNNSIIIADPLPANIELFFGNPVSPVQFLNGVPVSGLSLIFNNLADITDNVDFSNDGGSTFITPTVNASGFDITVPPINFIRLKPGGRLNGSVGGGNPSFSIVFRGRVK